MIRHPPRLPRRTALILAAVLGAAGFSAGSALGVARVGLGPTGNLAVAVDPGAGESDDHGLIVEPHFPGTGDSRTGFRVAQDALGAPTIDTVDPDCGRNVIFNDVVCNGAQGSASVSTGSGDDRVLMRDFRTSLGAIRCQDFGLFPDSRRPLRATLELGGGEDGLAVDPALGECPPGFADGSVRWSVAADGDAGDDTLSGGPADDTLGGGAGLDTLNGGAGVDDLRGGDDRDTLEGAQGNDTLRGGGGDDAFRGGGGDDLMHGGLDGAGPDTFDGGPGTDTVTYAFAGSGVSVTIETSNNSPDGRPGEDDSVFDNVENLTGSASGDALTGDGDANVLDGSLGGDSITGGAGADTLRGGDGNDTIDARDGIRDQAVDCGPGAGDVVNADLADQPLFSPVGSRLIPLVPNGCELRLFSAKDDGPPGRLTSGALRIGRDGVASVPLACPANARVACRGVLRLRTTRPRPRIRATARYAVARGTTEAIRITVPASLRGRTLQAETAERGVSRKGPRSSVRSVRIR